jgi:hypothetical protein
MLLALLCFIATVTINLRDYVEEQLMMKKLTLTFELLKFKIINNFKTFTNLCDI